MKDLTRAQELYDKGKWEESDEMIDEILPDLKTGEEFAEALRLKGWNRYYLGTKGPEEQKKKSLQMSRDAFQGALKGTTDKKKRISILNGLPLVLWALEKKAEALTISVSALAEFNEEPSVWNTAAILIRWTKKFETSLAVCERVYATALKREEYRTAGHGKRNKADVLKELGRVEDARTEYKAAIEMYRKFEEKTSESAEFHIKGVKDKLSTL